jgi:Protein of unknown function (DUF1360)
MKLETPRAAARAYAPQEDRPLASFLGLMAAYGTVVVAGAGALRRRGVRLPDRIELTDVALISVATHKVARLLAKDPITSPLRAPFTRFAGTSGDAELKEEVRGTGPRKAIGELVTCPFCLGQWVATGFVFGLITQPRATRAVASVFTVLAASDFLQHAYAHVQD